MKKSNFLLGVLTLVMLVSVGCTTHLPGNPTHDWLNGTWMTHRASGWTTELRLEVVDGNTVIGTNIQTAPDGKWGSGDVRGKVENDKVSFEVYFPHSGRTYTYALIRKGDTLEGRSSTGSVILKRS
ncbi:MAG: hypothetical protein Q7K26_02895 [bacterium]|nr:hypothetical protein [bacterium]